MVPTPQGLEKAKAEVAKSGDRMTGIQVFSQPYYWPPLERALIQDILRMLFNSLPGMSPSFCLTLSIFPDLNKMVVSILLVKPEAGHETSAGSHAGPRVLDRDSQVPPGSTSEPPSHFSLLNSCPVPTKPIWALLLQNPRGVFVETTVHWGSLGCSPM